MPDVVSRHYRHLRHKRGWVRTEESNDGVWHEAHVWPSEARRIARIGNVPAHLQDRWEHHLWGLLLMVSIADAPPGMVSRRRLLSELAKLEKLTDGAVVPSIEPRLKRDLVFFEAERLFVEYGWGGPPIRRPPGVVDSSEKLRQWFDDDDRARRNAIDRVERSLTNATLMRGLAREVHQWVSTRPVLRQEELAASRALDPARSYVADAMLNFWTTDLGRPLKVTKVLVAMTSAVYELWFPKMSVDAVKKQLHESAKGQRGEGELRHVLKQKRRVSR